MLTFKEKDKPVSFQTKFDFMASLQGEHISEVLTREDTHESAMVDMVVLANGKQSRAILLSLGKLLTLTALLVFFSEMTMFSVPSPSLFFTDTEEKTAFWSTLTNPWDGDIYLSLSLLTPFRLCKRGDFRE